MLDLRFTFTAELWPWIGTVDPKTGKPSGKGAAWVFVTMPEDDSEDIRDAMPLKAGFGSVRVSVQVGDTRWKTSVFPDSDSGCFVLPIKKAVRTAEGIGIGDTAEIDLEVIV